MPRGYERRGNGARRSDGKDLPNRSVPFYVPGGLDDPGQWRRDSVRYSSNRASSNGGRGGRSGRSGRSGDAASRRTLPESPSVRPVHIGLVAGLVFFLICVVVLVFFVLGAGSKGLAPASKDVFGTTSTAVAEVNAVGAIGVSGSRGEAGKSGGVSAGRHDASYDLNAADLLSIPGVKEVSLFAIGAGDVAVEPVQDGVAGIKAAVSAIEQDGNCGFVFLDVDNGYGLTYDADVEMYIASSAKAPYVYWLLNSGSELGEYDRQFIDWTITESDNESFESLFARFYTGDYASFMGAHGVQHDDYYYDYYPRMAARSLASIWAEIALYIRGGSADAQWLAGLFESTETSFIRDGLGDTGATVRDKAGWINELGYDGEYYYDEDEGGYYSGADYVSVSDAAIVEADGRTFLMVITTSQPDSGTAEANVSALARALFDARDML